MSVRLRNLALGLTFLVSTLYVRDAQALWPLSYSWHCGPASSATTVECSFVVTNPGPTGYQYQWLFGDGSQTGRTTTTTALRTYAVSTWQTFNVTLIGYATRNSSPDNIIQCSIYVENNYGVGGDPGTVGSCQQRSIHPGASWETPSRSPGGGLPPGECE